MKKKELDLAALKYKVFNSKNSRMEMQLKSQEQVEYLRELGVSVRPFVYIVLAKFPIGYVPQNSTPGIVKSVYYELRNRHRYKQFRELSPNQVKALKRAGLPVQEYKYRVTRV